MLLNTKTLAVAAICATVAPLATAQKTAIRRGEAATAKATIQQIDLDQRFVVLRGEDGSDIGVYAPPQFTRLGELKIGDTVTMTYYESIVYRLRRPGEPKPRAGEDVAATESATTLPGGTLSHQVTDSVTVTAVNRDVPSITVIGSDGRTMSRRVDKASDLAGLKPGDHIDITYTEAVLATVARAK